MTEDEMRESLIELLRRGTIYAVRGAEGQLTFIHRRRGGSEDALPVEDVIREISAQSTIYPGDQR